MSFHSLPPELLLEIFSLAAGNTSTSLDHRDHSNFVDNLSSFSLIHSSWRPIAQELLWEQVRLQGNGTEFKRKAKLLAELAHYPTRYLTIHGEIEQALELTGVGRWTSLKHLRVCDVGSREPLNLEVFARFSNLVTLDITLAGSFLVCDSDTTIAFPYLRRLVLEDDEWITPGLWNCKRFFTPACMPNLTHLSLDVLGRNPPSAILIFDQLFPQLTCLALGNSNPDYDYAIALHALGRLTKLKHLMLSVVNRNFASALFDNGAGLNLESLHLNSGLLWSDLTLYDRLLQVVKGEQETIKIKRIVLYGAREELDDLRVCWDTGSNLDLFTWRRYSQRAFVVFDGRQKDQD